MLYHSNVANAVGNSSYDSSGDVDVSLCLHYGNNQVCVTAEHALFSAAMQLLSETTPHISLANNNNNNGKGASGGESSRSSSAKTSHLKHLPAVKVPGHCLGRFLQLHRSNNPAAAAGGGGSTDEDAVICQSPVPAAETHCEDVLCQPAFELRTHTFNNIVVRDWNQWLLARELLFKELSVTTRPLAELKDANGEPLRLTVDIHAELVLLWMDGNSNNNNNNNNHIINHKNNNSNTPGGGGSKPLTLRYDDVCGEWASRNKSDQYYHLQYNQHHHNYEPRRQSGSPQLPSARNNKGFTSQMQQQQEPQPQPDNNAAASKPSAAKMKNCVVACSECNGKSGDGGEKAQPPATKTTTPHPPPPAAAQSGDLGPLFVVYLAVHDDVGQPHGEVPVHVADPIVSLAELTQSVRLLLCRRRHRTLRLAYRAVPPQALRDGKTVSALSTALQPLETQRDVEQLVADVLFYGCRCIRLVVVETDNGDGGEGGSDAAPVRSTWTQCNNNNNSSINEGGKDLKHVPHKPAKEDVNTSCHSQGSDRHARGASPALPRDVVDASINGHRVRASPSPPLVDSGRNSPSRKQQQQQLDSSKHENADEAFKRDVVVVRYEVDPTEVHVTGPVSEPVLQQLAADIYQYCCLAPREGGQMVVQGPPPPPPEFVKMHTSSSGASGTYYVLALHEYNFTAHEEEVLERCVADAMRRLEGYAPLPIPTIAQQQQLY